LFETLLIRRKILRDITINVRRSSCHIFIKLQFSQQIFEKYLNFIKIRPEEAGLFDAKDGQTDTKLKVALRDSVNTPNNHKMIANLETIYIYTQGVSEE
jgi:hypothetical protein